MANKLTDEDRSELIMEYLEEYEHYLRVWKMKSTKKAGILARTMSKK